MALCALSELEQYRVLPGLDIWVVPDFARHVLGCDAALLQRERERAYGIVGKGDAITPAAAQWVDGAHKALNYRGNELKRSKMWFQKGDPRECGYVKYYYTGWTRGIVSATSDVAACPLLAPVAVRYDTWAVDIGYPAANHYIVTKYVDGANCIGKVHRPGLAHYCGENWCTRPSIPATTPPQAGTTCRRGRQGIQEADGCRTGPRATLLRPGGRTRISNHHDIGSQPSDTTRSASCP